MDLDDMEILKIIKESQTLPSDFDKNNKIYSPNVIELCIFSQLTPTEEIAYKERRLNSFTSGTVKKKDDMWNVDLNLGGKFDSQGHFIQVDDYKNEDKEDYKNESRNDDNEDEFINTFWLIKNKEKIEGPFTLAEMKEKDLNGLMIKRNTDKNFYEYDKLNVEFYNYKEEEIKKEEIKEEHWTERCLKSAKFLRKRKCENNIENIQKEIQGLTKMEARSKLLKVTNLNEADVLEFLNIFLAEVGIEICSDVDKDGFTKVKKR